MGCDQSYVPPDFRPTVVSAKLSRPFHDPAQDTVDPGRIALAVLHEPVVNLLIDASGHQHLRSAAELRQLLVGQGRDAGIVNAGIVSRGLPLRDPGQDGFLRFIHWPAEDRFGAHACLLRGPR